MKVIPSDLITAVSASNANANYPDDNLLDEHPKRIWKSTGTTADITFTIQGGTSNAFALFNTNATGVSFILQNPNYVAWEVGTDWEDGTEWNAPNLTVTETTNLDGVNGACMVQWSDLTASIELTVSLTCAAGEVLYAGKAIAGNLTQYSGPRYGFTEGGFDYSRVTELSNGAVSVKDRDAVRVFDISASLSATNVNTFIGTIWKTLKSNPTCWVVTNESDSRWLVYARFTSPPQVVWEATDLGDLNFQIMEVL